MDYTTLGRTNLRVSVGGLGCGGNSKLGLGSGKTATAAAQPGLKESRAVTA